MEWGRENEGTIYYKQNQFPVFNIHNKKTIKKLKNPKMVFTNLKNVFLNEASLDLNFKRTLA
jgi:hypothetical protein